MHSPSAAVNTKTDSIVIQKCPAGSGLCREERAPFEIAGFTKKHNLLKRKTKAEGSFSMVDGSW